VWQLRADKIGKCVATHGFTLSRAQLANLVPPTPGSGGSSANPSGIQAILDQTSIQLDALTPGYQKALFDCQSSGPQLSDPIQSFQSWRVEVTKDLYARMKTAPQILAARDAETRCLRETGVDPATRAKIESDAVEINNKWVTGALSRASRDEQLKALLVKEAPIDKALDGCTLPRLATENVLISRFETAFLEGHSAALHDLGVKIKGELKAIGVIV
jgi:hypothetical protein